jgi:hypothetical protein
VTQRFLLAATLKVFRSRPKMTFAGVFFSAAAAHARFRLIMQKQSELE